MVIDIALPGVYETVFPKKNLNFVIAILLGLILPIVYITVKDYLNDKIVERKDVENITKLPIIGHIINSRNASNIIVAQSLKLIAESLRSIRTNIQFFSKGKEKLVILITSTMPSEGKTFASSNLATVYSLYGKKVLLMGFDLRKPKMYQDFGVLNVKGISSVLINKDTIEDAIQESPIENLDLMMGGPVPPNPSELIASDNTKAMLAKLREKYDYIIIDTPPIGLVTDAFLLMPLVDVTIFVCRQNYTNKKVFSAIMKDVEQRNIPNSGVLINDVKLTRGSYGYGYGYGYGSVMAMLRLWLHYYGYGYYWKRGRRKRNKLKRSVQRSNDPKS